MAPACPRKCKTSRVLCLQSGLYSCLHCIFGTGKLSVELTLAFMSQHFNDENVSLGSRGAQFMALWDKNVLSSYWGMMNCFPETAVTLSSTPRALPHCDFATSSIQVSEPWIWAALGPLQPAGYGTSDAVWLPRLGCRRQSTPLSAETLTLGALSRSTTSPATRRPPCWGGGPIVLPSTAPISSPLTVLTVSHVHEPAGTAGPAMSSGDCSPSHCWTATSWEQLSESCLAQPFPNSWPQNHEQNKIGCFKPWSDGETCPETTVTGAWGFRK